MVPGQIKAILFDLGDTLLNFGRINTARLLKEAGARTYSFLKQTNQPVRGYLHYLCYNFLSIRLNYFISGITGNDFDSLDVLKKYGKKKGFDLTAQQWEHVNWLWYEPLCEKATIEDNLAETLAKLNTLGLKLGIVSNTFVNATTLDKHLDMTRLLDFFPVRLYSYAFPKRKPHKSIFIEAAQQMQIEPANIMYVGDRIDKDVKGAIKAGMCPVLKKAYTNQGKKVPDGTVVIEKISELPDIVTKINSGSQNSQTNHTSQSIIAYSAKQKIDTGEQNVKQ